MSNGIFSREVKIFLTFFFLYSFFIQWYGWNEQSNFSLLLAIHEEKRFEIDSFANQTGDRSFYQNHFYTDKNPGLAFLSLPIFSTWKLIYYNLFPKSFIHKYEGDFSRLIGKQVGDTIIFSVVNPGFFLLTAMLLLTIFTSSLFSALSVLLMYKILKLFSKNETHRLLVTFAYGFGTLTFPQALHYMTHATGTLLLFFGFYLILKKKKIIPLLPALLIGFAWVVEKSILLILPLIFLYSFSVNRKKFVWLLLGFLIGSLPLFLYNLSIFKNPFDFTYAYIDRSIYKRAYPESKISIFFKELTQDKYMKFGIDEVIKHFHFIPSLPNFFVFIRLLFYPYRGIFFYSPILLLSLIGLVEMFKKYKKESLLIISIFLTFSLFIAMRRTWWGGYCFGNRYFLPTIPFLILPLIFSFKRVDRKIFIFLLILSTFINFLGLQPSEEWAYNWKRMDISEEWLEKQNSFQVISNPLVEHYFPLFIKHGPRSAILEHLINGYISIDIRTFPISKGINFPFSKVYIPFLSFIPLTIFLLLIWGKEVLVLYIKKLL